MRYIVSESWIEKQLCELVDRLRATGHRHTLEAELRFPHLNGDLSEGDFAGLLPEFREKGVLTDATPGGWRCSSFFYPYRTPFFIATYYTLTKKSTPLTSEWIYNGLFLPMKRSYFARVREKTTGGKGKKSYEPSATPLCIASLRSCKSVVLAPSIVSKQNARRNSLIRYISCNVSARPDDVKHVPSENTTITSENTGDVMVGRNSLRVWLNPCKLVEARTSRDRRAVFRERLRFWANAGTIHSRSCQFRWCDSLFKKHLT